MPRLTDDSLGVLEVQELPELLLRTTYHDTADLRLARNRSTLRYRTGEEGGPVWTLKLPVRAADGIERDEVSFAGGPDGVPAEAADLVTAFARSAPIAPVATLETRRRRWLLCGDGAQPLAELDDDQVSVVDQGHVVARFRELELESRGPDLEVLRPIANRLRRAGAVLAEPLPKAVRALGPRALADPDVVARPVSSSDPASAAVAQALAADVARVITNDPATRLGEAEGLHQMRVAARRLRSDLRTFRPLLDAAWSDALDGELRWLGGLLGTVRDGDVLLARLESLGSDLLVDLQVVRARLLSARETARSDLLVGLRSERYVALLDRLIDAARDPLVGATAAQPVRRDLPRLLERPWRAYRDAALALSMTDPEERYHAVRIKAKRLRYAAEALAAANAGSTKRLDRLARAATRMQDVLGQMHDDAVLQSEVAATLRESADGMAPTAFALAAGRLIERLAGAGSRVRGDVPHLHRRTAHAMKKAV